jgi:release factor glutamine methyltransferase
MDIAGQVLGRPLAWILAHPETELSEEASNAFTQAVEQVRAGHPLQYLTGRVQFWGLPLEVNEHVLIPRPETELLVQEVLRLPLPAEARVLDVGTGSGAIAASLKTERPGWRVEAMDVSPPALEVAARNLSALHLDVPVFPGEGLSGVKGRRDALVSNPPYIATSDLDRLPENVRKEPRLALDGGREGLDMIFTLIRQAPALLERGGVLALEIGADQGGKVLAFSRRLGYRRVRLVNDWADIGRVFIGVWSP